MRTNSLVLICAMLLLIAHPAFAQTWWRDTEDLRAMERDRKFDDILARTKLLLDRYREPRQIEQLYGWRAGAFEALQRWAGFVDEAKSLPTSALAQDKALMALVLDAYAQRLSRKKQGDQAIEVWRVLLQSCGDQSERCAWARISIGDTCRYLIKDAIAKAVPEYQAVERDYPQQKHAVAAALVRIADVCASLKDYRTAIDACDRVVHRYREEHDPRTIERYAINLGDYRVALEEWDAALAAWKEAEATFATNDSVRSDLVGRRAVLLQGRERIDEATVELQRTVASYGLANPGRCTDAARRLVDLYLKLKRYDEAARMAHVCLETDDLNWAIPKMVESLRGLDPEDNKLSAFILRECEGDKDSKTNAPHADVLAEIGYPKYPVEIEQAFDKSLADLGGDWESFWRKGRLCLYRGRPREAAAHMYRAFLLCAKQQEVGKIKRDLVEDVYHALHGTRLGNERWHERLLSGAHADDAELAALMRVEGAKRDDSADVNDALEALKICLSESYPPGVNPPQVTREREVLLDALARLSTAKGREGDAIAFCRRSLEDPNLAHLYDVLLQTGARMCRERDGALSGDFAFLEEVIDAAKSPAVQARARQLAQQHLGRMNALKNGPRQANAGLYRKHMPKKKK